jgi:MFS family permease
VSELWFVLVGCIVAIHGAIRAAWSPCGQSMLASLTPIAERARGSSWRVTTMAFAVGAIAAGTLGGTVLGAVGSLLPGSGWRAPVVLAVLLAALIIDATPLRRRMPLTKRQVNEDWMAHYRGWVYGFGFGAQLGLGFITLVACAAIYATFAIELLSGSIWAGAAIGAVFGASKATTLLPTRHARDPDSLMALHRRLLALEPHAQKAVIAAEILALVAVAGALG